MDKLLGALPNRMFDRSQPDFLWSEPLGMKRGTILYIQQRTLGTQKLIPICEK